MISVVRCMKCQVNDEKWNDVGKPMILVNYKVAHEDIVDCQEDMLKLRNYGIERTSMQVKEF